MKGHPKPPNHGRHRSRKRWSHELDLRNGGGGVDRPLESCLPGSPSRPEADEWCRVSRISLIQHLSWTRSDRYCVLTRAGPAPRANEIRPLTSVRRSIACIKCQMPTACSAYFDSTCLRGIFRETTKECTLAKEGLDHHYCRYRRVDRSRGMWCAFGDSVTKYSPLRGRDGIFVYARYRLHCRGTKQLQTRASAELDKLARASCDSFLHLPCFQWMIQAPLLIGSVGLI